MPMKSLVKSPESHVAVRRPAAKVHDYSPDDLLIVQKRQDWRLRVAHICLEHFEHLEKAEIVAGRRLPEEAEKLLGRYARIADYLKRELPSLLASGVAVHELEALRYQANYFLEEVVRHVRNNIQGRGKTKNPLQDASPEQVESEVTASLREQTDSLCVFVEDLVKLAEFELEVGNQRERIRLLLGGDRRLSGLGNNETIMSAPLGQLWRALDDFVSIHAYLRENLPPLLDKSSPYRVLEEELKVANEQLQALLRDRVVPFERHLNHKRAQDRVLEELESTLEDSFHQAESILEIRIGPLAKQADSPREDLIQASELDNLFIEAERLLELVGELAPEVCLPPMPVGAEVDGHEADLAELESSIRAAITAAAPVQGTAFLRRGKGGGMPDRAHLVEVLAELRARLGELRSKLAPGAPEVRAIRERKLRPLREQFCGLVGELRTFLQTAFAHIASKDPRSTESSYHFFLREFSDESRQAILLLKEIRALEAYINNLLRVHVAGLPLTPENLARILRVLFIDKGEEKKRIPSGEGWKVMSAFLRKLRDELVPRLQKVCAFDGIRYEDKNFLSEWAMDLAHNCTLCLTQHEIGYNLIQEMGRLRDDDSMTTRQSHTHIVVTKTCNAMQKSLTEICMTLTASIPYVGIMRGGVERRASVFFHRQQKILESGEVAAEEPKSGEAESEPIWA